MSRIGANADKVAWRVVDGEAVIVHADSSAYYGLNSTGTFIWEAIAATPLAAEEIAARLGERYGLEPGAARVDVDAFVTSLGGEGLLLEAADTATGAIASPLVARAAPGGYEPPALAKFGELEQLVLSGE
jgi:Coenzyme PQQ synthesis protein D (PqqD)